MKEDKKKKMIALELPNSMYEDLRDLCAIYSLSVSGVVRLIISDYLRRYIDKEEKENIK